MVAEPQGALTYRSSTPIVLADSDPLHGLLLIVLGSRSDFMAAEPQGAITCSSSTLTVWKILTRFIDYYSPFWGKEQFHWLLNPEVRLRAGY